MGRTEQVSADDVTSRFHAPDSVPSLALQEGQQLTGHALVEAVAGWEHADTHRRMGRILLLALCVWPAFALTDVLVAATIATGSLAWFLTLRLAGWLVVVACWLSYRRNTLASRSALRIMDLTLFILGSVILSLMATRVDAITSTYAPGLMVLCLARAALVAEPWRRGAPVFGAMAGSFPLVMGIFAVVEPSVRSQLGVTDDLVRFALMCCFLAAAAVAGTLASHSTYVFRLRWLSGSSDLGFYKLEEEIGRGGMGTVSRAVDLRFGHRVALKLVRPSPQSFASASRRFEIEARATASLSHPNVVRLFDIGVVPTGVMYIAMELLEGRTLQRLVEDEGPLSPARAVHLVGQAAQGLAAAHEQRLIHRDVKPSNLFVTVEPGRGEVVKVIDFGLAEVQPAPGTVPAETGGASGTVHFMAPERFNGEPGADRDPRVDVYSLGVVLYFALTGKRPFDAERLHTVILQHVEAEPDPPSGPRGGAVPGDLEAVVMRCLEKEPGKRFPDAGALVDALEGCAVRGSREG